MLTLGRAIRFGERRRAVAARQAEAHLVAALRVGLPHRVQQRRPDAAAVARVGLALLDRCRACVMPSQRRPACAAQCSASGSIRPARRRRSASSRRRRCRRSRSGTAGRSAALVRVSVRRFDSTSTPDDQAVLVEDRRDELAARGDRRVVRVARVLEGARLAAVGELGAKAVRPARAPGRRRARHSMRAVGAEAMRPLAVQARQRAAAARRRSAAVS